MTELEIAKADRAAVEIALNVKADKDMVAKDTEANLRAVDAALNTMNAGTQGIQQLLEKQVCMYMCIDMNDTMSITGLCYGHRPITWSKI